MLWLGLTAIAFTIIHDAVLLYKRRWWDLAWVCHLSSAIIGVGCIFDWPYVVGIAVVWLFVGLTLWIVGLLTSEDFLPTSTLTHVGGLVIGVIYISQRGMPDGVWWRGILILIAIQHLTRYCTPAQENVNLAFFVSKGWESWFPTYPRYWLMLKVASIIMYLIAEFGLRALFGEPSSA